MSKIEEMLVKSQEQNPTVAPGKAKAEMSRIPLSVPQRKLEVPDIPGYYMRWFRGTPARLAQAQRAGFVFVKPQEVMLNMVSLGGDATKSGNSDMGDMVSVIEGSEVDGGGQAVRLYLMKQLMEHRLEDDKITQTRNDQVVDSIVGSMMSGGIGAGQNGEQGVDAAQRYVPKNIKIPELFKKKTGAQRQIPR